MFACEQNMAQRINVVLHDFVDEDNVSNSDDDECSSIGSDVEAGLKTHPAVFWDQVSHELTMQALKPTVCEKFVQFGYIHSQHTRLMKLFTMPHDYKNAKKDDVAQTIQATVLAVAKPPPAPEPIAQPPRKTAFHCFILPSKQQYTVKRETVFSEIQFLCNGLVYSCARCLMSEGSVYMGGFVVVGSSVKTGGGGLQHADSVYN